MTNDGRRRSLLAIGLVLSLTPVASAQQSRQTVGNITFPGRYHLRGSGTTNPSKLLWWAMDTLEERAGSAVHMTYRSVGSGRGKRDWANFDSAGDFASTDYGLEPSSTHAFLQIPFQIGAVSLFVNLPGVTTGQLKLSADVVAKIFTGTITRWDDAAILADNPGLSLPNQPIKVCFRTNGSSSTRGLQGYMNATSSSYTGATDGSTWSGESWANAAYGVDGSDGMRKMIKDNTYSIGYIDAGHGHEHGNEHGHHGGATQPPSSLPSSAPAPAPAAPEAEPPALAQV